MKILISIIFLLVLKLGAVAQKNLEVKYIISKDTLSGVAKVYTNMFDKERITELSFTQKLILKDNDERKKINASDIKLLEFIDFKGQKRKFISSDTFPEFGLKDVLLEEKIVGNISWYKYYYGSLMSGNQTTVNYFVNKERLFIKGEGGANIRKRLPNIIKNIDKFREKIGNIKGFLIDEIDIKITEFLVYYNQEN